MRANLIRERLREGRAVALGWLTIPSSLSAEMVAAQGYDAVNVDLQHGMIDFTDAVPMLQAIGAAGAMPVARVPTLEPGLIMKLLDAGAYAIICPMISTVDDARRFVAACRYPPAGHRSFGPVRGVLYGGPDYFDEADREIFTIGMIETREGLENLDAIAAVDGLDMLFIGPNDLSIAFGKPPGSEPEDPEVIDAIRRIRERAGAHDKSAGIFCSSGTAAARRVAEGFQLVAPGTDGGWLSEAATEALAEIREA